MEVDMLESQPQTQKFFLWCAVIAFCTVSIFMLSSYREETERLGALRDTEKQKRENLNKLEAERLRTTLFLDRFTRDPEFVNDQARERLGVAAPGELVIRVDSLPPPVPVNVTKPAGKPTKPTNR
jgi:cell division protein FtsB